MTARRPADGSGGCRHRGLVGQHLGGGENRRRQTCHAAVPAPAPCAAMRRIPLIAPSATLRESLLLSYEFFSSCGSERHVAPPDVSDQGVATRALRCSVECQARETRVRAAMPARGNAPRPGETLLTPPVGKVTAHQRAAIRKQWQTWRRASAGNHSTAVEGPPACRTGSETSLVRTWGGAGTDSAVQHLTQQQVAPVKGLPDRVGDDDRGSENWYYASAVWRARRGVRIAPREITGRSGSVPAMSPVTVLGRVELRLSPQVSRDARSAPLDQPEQ